MNKNIFYNKKTIIWFIILSVFFTYGLTAIFSILQGIGAGTFIGFPFEIYFSNASLGPENMPRFSGINLILDLIIYYAVAVLISWKFSKK